MPREPCGPLAFSHYLTAVWTCALTVEEAHQLTTNYELYKRQIKTNLLDALDADAFVVGRTEKAPSEAERAAVRSLGPRVVSTKRGPDEQILDMALFHKVAAAPMMGWSFYSDRRRKIASQWLGRTACRDAVLKHEASRGAAYTMYVRVRLDISFFAPLPSEVFAAARRS